MVTWQPCFGEALQRCITTALGDGQVSGLAEILEKSRNIGEYFRGTETAINQLEKAQEELGLPRKKLKLDCEDRWNSTVKYITIMFSVLFIVIIYFICFFCLQCFDTVGCASGRAPGL